MSGGGDGMDSGLPRVRWYKGTRCWEGHTMRRPWKRSLEITWGPPIYWGARFLNISITVNRTGTPYVCGKCMGIQR